MVHFVTDLTVGDRRFPGATILGASSPILPPTVQRRSRRLVQNFAMPCCVDSVRDGDLVHSDGWILQKSIAFVRRCGVTRASCCGSDNQVLYRRCGVLLPDSARRDGCTRSGTSVRSTSKRRASLWQAVAAAAIRDITDVAASLWPAFAAAANPSFQAVRLACMIVTVSGNLPHIDFTVSWWTYLVVGPSEMGHTQALGAYVSQGLHLEVGVGLSSPYSLAELSFSSIRHAAFHFLPDHGLVIWWVNCYVVPRLFNRRRSAESGTLGTSSKFLNGALWCGAGRASRAVTAGFKLQGTLVFTRVVDKSLLLMVLSVPASPQKILGGPKGPLTRDTPRSSSLGAVRLSERAFGKTCLRQWMPRKP